MIQNQNSVPLQGKNIYEGQLQLYSFKQQNFLHEYKIIRDQLTVDKTNSSNDATKQDIRQRNEHESTRPERVGVIGRAGGLNTYIKSRIGKARGPL